MKAKSVTKHNRFDEVAFSLHFHTFVSWHGISRPIAWDGMPNAGTTSAITDNVTLWILGWGQTRSMEVYSILAAISLRIVRSHSNYI